MLRKFVLLFGIFLIIPRVSLAQLVTQNAYVEADVSSDGLGLVRIYYANTDHSTFISNPAYHSYLTFQVNGNYYTNNPHLDTLATFSFPLKNGVTAKIADTIETVWQVDTADMFEVIQDVYPVAFPYAGSGQIVYKFSIRNLEDQTLSAQAEYLLDIDLGAPGNQNDNPPITTRYGYVADWLSFPSSNPVPPYYIATLDLLTNNNFPTLVAMGYNNDTFAPGPMGLIQPDAFTYANWQTVAQQWTWGFPTTPGLKDSDAALLIQWPPCSVSAGAEAELGRGSFGSASCTPICIGNLNLLTVHPSHIVWDPAQNTFVPSHFPVDAIFWDPGSETTTALGTQSITNSVTGFPNGPIRIVSPLPTADNGYTQQHSIIVAAGLFTSAISWEDTVVPGVLVNCSTDSSYDITFNIDSKGLINYNGFCSCPIFVDCQEKDVTPPRHSPHIGVGSEDSCGSYTVYRDSVFDNNSTDQGLQSIAWFVTPSASSIEVDTGTHSPCSPSKVPITISQLDLAHAPCVYFTFTDCAGNISFDSICFAACAAEVVDTVPPKFRLLSRYDWNATADTSCGFKCSKWVVTDSVIEGFQHNGGLASITVVDFTNMTFALSEPVIPSMKEDSFTTCVMDSTKDGSIAISVVDEDGNVSFKTISYCPASASVSIPALSTITLSILPNPVSDDATIAIQGAPSADVEIYDVLGREVDHFQVNGSYDWETGELPSGTYILRASAGSQMLSKRIIKR